MKFAHEMRKEKEELAKQREEFDAWKSRQADRKRNPAKYLGEEYGQDWYDKLTQVKLNGSPTPDLIASEVDDRVAYLEKKLAESETKWQEELKRRDEAAQQQERQSYLDNAIKYVKSSADKFPLIHAAGAQDNVLQVIDNHFRATAKQDEDGNWQPGELLTAEEACEKLEKYIEDLAEKAQAARAKKLAAKPPEQNPATKPNSIPQRRTLSTDMTAGSGEKAPPLTEAERIKRAIAAMTAAEAR